MINISLHIRKLPPATVGGGYSEVKYSKCQDLPKFQFFWRGGGILKSNTQSAKICLIFNFLGGDSEVKYSKCQDLPKFQFFWRGGGILKSNTQSAKICLIFNFGGGILKSNTQSAKICLIFNFFGGGILKSNTQSAKICLIFNFHGGGHTLEPNSRTGVFWRIWAKIYCLRSTVQKPACASLFEVNCTETCLCITDSLSHTTYVETNEMVSLGTTAVVCTHQPKTQNSP